MHTRSCLRAWEWTRLYWIGLRAVWPGPYKGRSTLNQPRIRLGVIPGVPGRL